MSPALYDIEALRAQLLDLDGLVVAFSGGVDSAVLLQAALEFLGKDRVIAVIADSPSLARAELVGARALALQIGAKLLVLQTQELEDPRYRANSGNRCFWCKEQLFLLAGIEAQKRGWSLAYGENADDRGADRPGALSAAMRGVLAPLRQANWSKDAVRAFAADRKLSVADKPAAPCLASRVAVGVAVDLDALQRIEALELALKARGYQILRARHLAPHFGALEFGAAELERAEAEVEVLVALAAEHGYHECVVRPYLSGSVA